MAPDHAHGHEQPVPGAPPRQAGVDTTPNPRWLNIGQLTDVSFCKLQQYF